MTDTSIKVACTFVPLHNYNLLVPNTCIPEVLMRKEIQESNSIVPWHIGDVLWLDRQLPVISFENIDTTIKHTSSKKPIIIVIHYPWNEHNLTYFGILANEIPQVVHANSQTLDRQLNPNQMHSHALSYVHINDRSALIPDLQRIAIAIQR